MASFPVPPAPGVTQQGLGTHAIVLTHTGPLCFLHTQRGGCNNGLEWHSALLAPTLHLCFSVLESAEQLFPAGGCQPFIFSACSSASPQGPGQWEPSGRSGPGTAGPHRDVIFSGGRRAVVASPALEEASRQVTQKRPRASGVERGLEVTAECPAPGRWVSEFKTPCWLRATVCW